MKQKGVEKETWLDLSEAAQYLGVHFTTLRRWADAGEIQHLRTPGGRRRFSLTELQAFLHRSEQIAPAEMAIARPFEARAIDHARQNAQFLLTAKGEWMNRLSVDQRTWLRGTGHRLMALLMQFNSRTENGETFLEEACRIAREYGQVCAGIGLPLKDTVRVFLYFRRSILDAVQETVTLTGTADQEAHLLVHRTTDFFDELLMDLIENYPSGGSSEHLIDV